MKCLTIQRTHVCGEPAFVILGLLAGIVGEEAQQEADSE